MSGRGAAAATLSAEEFAALTGVSRETCERLARYLDLLRHWQRAINLVGRGSLDDPWRRHLLDSAQLLPLAPPGCGPWLDLGSGAGLPGLVLAILGAPDVHLVESDGRKCAFLAEAARLTGAPVTVHHRRIEAMAPVTAAVVTARALAPLPKLLAWAARFAGPDTVGLFLKGREVAKELTGLAESRTIAVERLPSRSDPSGVVLRVRGLGRA